MRKIIFRGKLTTTGEWAEGFLVSAQCIRNGTQCVPVNPETVGQFTGLHDKNGRGIFEGDIVQYKDELGEILYCDSEAMFCVSFHEWATDFDHLCGKDIEVIGIIHDTPEPLEVNEDG